VKTIQDVGFLLSCGHYGGQGDSGHFRWGGTLAMHTYILVQAYKILS